MSTRQPSVTVGTPQLGITVLQTGDRQIDNGLKNFLERQFGIHTVRQRYVDHKTIEYKIGLNGALSLDRLVKEIVVSIETYYSSWGMDSEIQLVNDL